MGIETALAAAIMTGIQAAVTSAAVTTAATAAVVGGAAVGGYALAGGFSGDKGGESGSTQNVQENAAAIEARTKEAEALADAKAKEEARKKLSQQTQTIFTSGLGLLGTNAETKKTTLGSN